MHKSAVLEGVGECPHMQDRNHRIADLAARRQERIARTQEDDAARARRFAEVDIFEAQLHFRIQGVNGGNLIEVAAISEIGENLWMGGAVPGAPLPDSFMAMISCHPWTPYLVVHPIRAYMALPLTDSDADLEPGSIALVEAAAALLNVCRAQGPVLVHCTAGLNRSALVVGLALVRAGMHPDQAIEELRARRSPHVFNNLPFELWLRQQRFERPPPDAAGFSAI